jgi:hypothetical protein
MPKCSEITGLLNYLADFKGRGSRRFANAGASEAYGLIENEKGQVAR